MAASFRPVPFQRIIQWDNVPVILRRLYTHIPVMCAECFKTERNIIKLLCADYILREIDHAAFCNPYLVVVGIMPTGNQHTELFKGDFPDVIRFYLLPIQYNGLPPPCEKLLKFLMRAKHSLIYHLPIKILFFIKFYILQVAFGR